MEKGGCTWYRFVDFLRIFMIYLSQRDLRWANQKMLPSNLTLGRFGCTTTSISMLSDYFKCFVRPDWMIGPNVKYTNDGLIIWQSIEFPKFKFETRRFGWQLAEIDKSIKDPNKAVILQVNNGAHWVVAIRRIPMTKHYFIVDPWTGRLSTTMAYKNVTGSAHFIRK